MAAFMRAAAFADQVLERAIAQARATLAAAPLVAKAADYARADGVMVIDREGVPWQEFVERHAWVRVVIVPDGRRWAVRCVQGRASFPQWAWRDLVGATREQMEAFTGIPGMSYYRGFVAGAATLEAAHELARAVLRR